MNRVHSIAFNARMEIAEARRRAKDAMRRSVIVNGHHRVSGRPHDGDSYFRWTNGHRRAGRGYYSNAPKSPTTRWLEVAGYHCAPF